MLAEFNLEYYRIEIILKKIKEKNDYCGWSCLIPKPEYGKEIIHAKKVTPFP